MKDPARFEPMPVDRRPASIACGISVIVPVLDGGETFAELLRAIRSQKKAGEVEILALDSESTDGSASVAESFGCRVITIPRKEFSHGATRNLGAEQARGEYLVFTVQDAVPVSRYWLYGMVSPFFSVPDLGVVTSKQFTRPETDLYSLFTNDALNAMTGFTEDFVYGLSPSFDFAHWNRIDWLTKRRVSYVDNVSSCIPRRVYAEVPFRPLINAEDMDLGVRMLEKGKRLGFLATTGVFHWHDRGPDYVLKRHYIGTKAGLYIMGNDLPRFYETHGIDWRTFGVNVADLLDLVELSLSATGMAATDPVKAAGAFVSAFRRFFRAAPEEISTEMGKIGGSCAGRLEAACPGVFGDADFLSRERHRFGKNFLVPLVLRRLEALAGFLVRKGPSCKGREPEFGLCIRKIVASVIGEAAGAFYLESETRGRLTEDLERMDRLLAKGVCRS